MIRVDHQALTKIVQKRMDEAVAAALAELVGNTYIAEDESIRVLIPAVEVRVPAADLKSAEVTPVEPVPEPAAPGKE